MFATSKAVVDNLDIMPMQRFRVAVTPVFQQRCVGRSGAGLRWSAGSPDVADRRLQAASEALTRGRERTSCSPSPQGVKPLSWLVLVLDGTQPNISMCIWVFLNSSITFLTARLRDRPDQASLDRLQADLQHRDFPLPIPVRRGFGRCGKKLEWYSFNDRRFDGSLLWSVGLDGLPT